MNSLGTCSLQHLLERSSSNPPQQVNHGRSNRALDPAFNAHSLYLDPPSTSGKWVRFDLFRTSGHVSHVPFSFVYDSFVGSSTTGYGVPIELFAPFTDSCVQVTWRSRCVNETGATTGQRRWWNQETKGRWPERRNIH